MFYFFFFQRYFHLVANELWRWLSESFSDRHKTAVELLLTLHQVIPACLFDLVYLPLLSFCIS